MLLVVDKSERQAVTLAELFRLMGVVAYGVTPRDALSEISMRYSAVLITHPEKLPDLCDFVARLHAYIRLPVYLVGENYEGEPEVSGTFRENTYPAVILRTIRLDAKRQNLHAVGDYRLAGIDASIEYPSVIRFDKAIPLTRTEALLLRFLMRNFPACASPKEILVHIFKKSKEPDLSNVRTHISVINKKFRAAFGNNIIINPEGNGYRIITAAECEALEIAAEKKETVTV